MLKNLNEDRIKDIDRDIPLIHQKITRCYTTINDFETAIRLEKDNKTNIQSCIDVEEGRSLDEKAKYHIPSLIDNLKRCDANIELFCTMIEKEHASIRRFQDIIAILLKDREQPTGIVFDLRKQHGN